LPEHGQRERPHGREHGDVIVHRWTPAGDAGQVSVYRANQRWEVLPGAGALDMTGEGLRRSVWVARTEHPVHAVGLETVCRAEVRDL